MSSASAEFSQKARSLLGADSPLFDALWPNIFDMADPKTQYNLHLTHSYFKRMWERADIHHKSDRAKSEYIGLRAQHSYPKECQLDIPSSLWYSWGAYKAGFGSEPAFYEFCEIAGVDPESGIMMDPDDEGCHGCFCLPIKTSHSPHLTILCLSTAGAPGMFIALGVLDYERNRCGLRSGGWKMERRAGCLGVLDT